MSVATVTTLGFAINSEWNGSGVRAAEADFARLEETMTRLSSRTMAVDITTNANVINTEIEAMEARLADREVAINVIAHTEVAVTSMDEAVAAVDRLEAAQQRLNEMDANMVSAQTLTQASTDLLTAAMTRAAEAADLMAASFERAGKRTAESKTAADRAAASMAGLGGTMGTFSRATTIASGAGGDLGNTLNTTGKVSAAVFAGGMYEAVSKAGDFQRAMTLLVTSAGLPKTAMDDLGNALLQVSTDTGTAATDLAAASYKVLSLGFSWQDTAKIMHDTAELAKVDNSDIVTTTQAVVTTLHDYQMGASDSTNVSNALRAAVERSNTTLGDFTYGIGRTEQVASALGMSFEQVYGALATLTEKGFPATNAIALLNTTITHLAESTPQSTAELDKLGINATQFHQTLQGPNGLVDTLSMLQDAIKNKLGPNGLVWLQTELKKSSGDTNKFAEALGNVPPQMQTQVDAFARAVGGVRNLSVVLGLTGENLDRFKDNVNYVTEAGQKNATQIDGWAQAHDTFNVRLSSAKEAFVNLFVVIGNQVLPAMTGFAEALTNGATWLGHHKTVLDSVGIALGVIGGMWITYKASMAVASIAQGVWNVVSGIGTAALWLYQTAIGETVVALHIQEAATKVAAAAQWLFNAAMDANPIVWVVIFIAALIAAIVYLAVKTQFFQIIWRNVWQWCKTAFHAVIDFFVDKWNDFLNFWKSTWDTVSGAFKTAWHAVWDFLSGIVDAVVGFVVKIVDAVVGYIVKFAEGLIAPFLPILKRFGQFFEGLWQIWMYFMRGFYDAWLVVWHGVNDFVVGIWNWIKARWDDFLLGIKIAWDIASGIISAAWTVIWDWISGKAKAVWDWLVDQWNIFLGILKLAYDVLIQPLVDAWNAVWNWISAVAKAIWDWITGQWNDFINGVKLVWTIFSTLIKTEWNACWTAIHDFAVGLWDKLKSGWQGLSDKTKEIFTDLKEGLKHIWDDLVNVFKTPINLVINTWNDKVVSHFPGVTKVDPLAAGGPVIGPGGPTDDQVPLWGSAGEHMWTAAEVQAAGGHAAMYRMRRQVLHREGNIAADNRFAGGGAVEKLATASDMAAQKGDNRAYVYGGSGPDGFDCSGYMSAIYNVLTGAANWWSRAFSTESDFGSLGFLPGLGAGFAIGVHNGGGGPNSHMAGTLNGVNVESGGPHDSTLYGGLAVGADHSQFEHQYYLPVIDGDFVSGGPGGGGGGFVRTLLSKLFETVTNPFLSVIPDPFPGTSQPLGSFPKGAATRARNDILDWIKGNEKNAVGMGGGISGTLPEGERLAVIDQALQFTSTPPPNSQAAWETGLNTLIQRESGWNPGAVNNTDSNAAAGTPSKGLAQVIQPTFDAYHQPGTSNDIFDAVANISAACNYIKARYGDISNVQQADASQPPRGYAEGTLRARSGWSILGERGPEAVNLRGGETVYSFDDIVKKLVDNSAGVSNDMSAKLVSELRTLGDRMQSQSDLVRQAITDALERALAEAGINIPLSISGSNPQDMMNSLSSQLLPRLEMMLRQQVGAL